MRFLAESSKFLECKRGQIEPHSVPAGRLNVRATKDDHAFERTTWRQVYVFPEPLDPTMTAAGTDSSNCLASDRSGEIDKKRSPCPDSAYSSFRAISARDRRTSCRALLSPDSSVLARGANSSTSPAI